MSQWIEICKTDEAARNGGVGAIVEGVQIAIFHFANTDEWYESIPEEVRPSKDQPYYHLFAENERTHYVAYVSEQNLIPDEDDTRVSHPDIAKMFELTDHGYVLKAAQRN